MTTDVFAVIAEPRRRDILGALQQGPASVGELVERLSLSQPMVSKHLRVLKDHGLVSSRSDAQRRIYAVEPGPLLEVEVWLRPYRDLWSRSFDALATHLDAQPDPRPDPRPNPQPESQE